jgi:hypothetical protein
MALLVISIECSRFVLYHVVTPCRTGGAMKMCNQDTEKRDTVSSSCSRSTDTLDLVGCKILLNNVVKFGM